MSAHQVTIVLCDKFGCGSQFMNARSTLAEARYESEHLGWRGYKSGKRVIDVCPEHATSSEEGA